MPSLNYREFYSGWIQRELDELVAQINALFFTEHNEDGTHRAGGGLFGGEGGVPIGALMPYAAATAPTGWLICDGSQKDRVTYKSLFEIIGTTYGAGDGSTTFNIPNTQGRFILGKAVAGTGSVLGGTGGAIDHTHSGSAHTHSFSATTSSDGSHSHGGSTSSDGSHSHSQGAHSHAISSVDEAEPGAGPDVRAGSTQTDINNDAGTSTNGQHSHSVSTSSDGSHNHSVSGTTGSAGASTTGAENPPFLATPYIIFSGVA